MVQVRRTHINDRYFRAETAGALRSSIGHWIHQGILPKKKLLSIQLSDAWLWIVLSELLLSIESVSIS